MAEQRYTLPQIARRVRLTEGRIRAMYGQGRLPDPDGTDPDGKPYWLESTVDGWIRSTGRSLPDGAAWPWTWPAATAPAREVAREDVLVNAHGDPAPATVVVWDTGHGHVAYVMRHRADTMLLPAALTAAVVLHPAHWGPAIVLVPDHHLLGRAEEHVSIDAYRLLAPHRDLPAQTRRLPRFLAAFLGDPDDDVAQNDHEPVDVSRVRIKHIGIPHADAIAEVLGRPLPIWIDYTCTPENARASAAYGDAGTLTVPDTTTDWPATRDRLAAAVGAGLHTRHPQAFTTLAKSVVRDLRFIERQHEQTRERGAGWYLAARPARPQWDVALEHLTMTAAARDVDPEAAAAELPALRAEEADLPWEDPAAPAMFEAAGHLAVRLHTTHPGVVFSEPVRHHVEATGPVTDQFIASLTRVDDPATRDMLTRPTRRLARLLTREAAALGPGDRNLLDRAAERLTALYRDRDGRLVAAFAPAHGQEHASYVIEWSTDLPAGWTDATVIAADPSPSGALVVALTPTPDGQLRTDLLPNPGDEPGYGWGYNGGSPWRLYQALTRCALGTWLTPLSDDPSWMMHLHDTPAGSPLYHHLVTHHGPLRMPWHQIQQWVRNDDHKTAAAPRPRPEPDLPNEAVDEASRPPLVMPRHTMSDQRPASLTQGTGHDL